MANTNLTELLTYIAKSLVDNPDEVSVVGVLEGDTLTLQLRVASGDMGRVIGKQGRIAKEIRTLVKAVGSRQNQKVLVDMLD